MDPIERQTILDQFPWDADGQCEFKNDWRTPLRRIDLNAALMAMKGHGGTSDGYHTFDELYDHRITLYIALCRQNNWEDNELGCSRRVWRSKLHSDGTMFEGQFILGIGKEPGEQITYHLPLSRWEETDFAETLEKAPEWDKHTSDDVLERLKRL